jgi:hypothetical protein
LNPDKNGKLTIEQIMELPEFKFCAFKSFLPQVLKLTLPINLQEQGNNNNNNALISQGTIVKRVNGTIIDDDDDESNIEVYNNKENNMKKIRINNQFTKNYKNSEKNITDNPEENTNFNKLLILEENKMNGEGEEADPKKYERLDPDRGKKDEATPTPTPTPSPSLPFIDFLKFCDTLKYFNPKFPVDFKIKCIHFIFFKNYKIFFF